MNTKSGGPLNAPLFSKEIFDLNLLTTAWSIFQNNTVFCCFIILAIVRYNSNYTPNKPKLFLSFFLLVPSAIWEFCTFFRKVRYSFNRRSCYNYHHSYHCPATTTTTATSTRGSGTQQFFKWAWDYHWPQWFCPKTGGQMCWCKRRIGKNGSKWDLYEDQTSSTQSQKERNACSTGYDKSRIERKRSCGM